MRCCRRAAELAVRTCSLPTVEVGGGGGRRRGGAWQDIAGSGRGRGAARLGGAGGEGAGRGRRRRDAGRRLGRARRGGPAGASKHTPTQVRPAYESKCPSSTAPARPARARRAAKGWRGWCSGASGGAGLSPVRDQDSSLGAERRRRGTGEAPARRQRGAGAQGWGGQPAGPPEGGSAAVGIYKPQARVLRGGAGVGEARAPRNKVMSRGAQRGAGGWNAHVQKAVLASAAPSGGRVGVARGGGKVPPPTARPLGCRAPKGAPAAERGPRVLGWARAPKWAGWRGAARRPRQVGGRWRPGHAARVKCKCRNKPRTKRPDAWGLSVIAAGKGATGYRKEGRGAERATGSGAGGRV
ncbi:MAG: hypothetical protein J3K34DRAFT_284678 [Monoraphidium minutum]|nr:MAG: hypothetical protein J3K34DRAFT_284678 [Monoraphidium minutum]